MRDRLGPLRTRLSAAVKSRLITTERLEVNKVDATTTCPAISTQRLYLARRESLYNAPVHTSTTSQRPTADEQPLCRQRRSGPAVNGLNSAESDHDSAQIDPILSTDTASYKAVSTCSGDVSISPVASLGGGGRGADRPG